VPVLPLTQGPDFPRKPIPGSSICFLSTFSICVLLPLFEMEQKKTSDWLLRRNTDWLQGRSSAASGFTVLIADDSETDIFFLLRAFAASGVKNPIQVVRSGLEALDYLKGEGKFSDRIRYPVPRIVFLDLAMPKLDGYQILQWKQTRADYRNVLFVAMSNFDSAQSINRAYISGASTFLSKPLDSNDVRNLVEAFDGYWIRGDVSSESLRSEAHS
jgi:CheY-like chemotaxis protein